VSIGSQTIAQVFYWNNGVYNGKTSGGLGKTSYFFQTPANTTHVSCNIDMPSAHSTETFNAVMDTLQIEQGSVATAYSPYEYKYLLNSYNDPNSDMVNSIKELFLNVPQKNKYDKSLAVDGRYYSTTTGAVNVSATAAITGEIPVIPNKRYVLSIDAAGDGVFAMHNIFYWDADGNYIGRDIGDRVWDDNSKYIIFTVPYNAYFVGVNFLWQITHTTEDFVAMSGTIQLEDGGIITSYEPYETESEIKKTSVYENTQEYSGKKWVCVGDSLTGINDATTMHYFDYISANLGMEIVNMGVGGTGYMRGYDINAAFYQRISGIQTDTDFTTIFGSGNDLALYANIGNYTDTGTSTICGCVNTTLDNYFSACPIAPIGIIAPTPWASCPTTVPGNNMELYAEKLRAIAAYRGIPFLDLYHGSNLRPENEANLVQCFYNSAPLDGNGDGVHPNELGHKIIATKISEFIKTLC